MNLNNTYRSALVHLTKTIRGSLALLGEPIGAPLEERAQYYEHPVGFKREVPQRKLTSRFWAKLRSRRKLLLVSALWALVIILVVIKVHWLHYLQNPRFSIYKIALSYRGPQMGLIDLLILGVASALIGILLGEDSIFLSYMLAFGIASLGLVGYTLLYIWFVLGWGELLALFPGTAGLELITLWAILNVTWIMFPAAVLICLLGVISGAFLGSWIRPYS